MIYHPKLKSRAVAFSPDPGFGDLGIRAENLLSLTENSLGRPSAVLEALTRTKLSWVSDTTSGFESIKYSDPPDDISREIRALRSFIENRSRVEVAAWRKRKNAAVAAIRQSLMKTVPIYRYRRERRTKTITYIKKLRLPYSLGVSIYQSGASVRYGSSEYGRLLQASTAIHPFDKVFTVRVKIEKSVVYHANVRYVAGKRVILSDRKELNDRVADWVAKNPPYRASQDASLAASRQRLHALRLKRGGQYNQCAACRDISAVGRASELRSVARAMVAQYLVDPATMALAPYIIHNSDQEGASFKGFVIKDEWYREPYEDNGMIVEGQWITQTSHLPEWEAGQGGRSYTIRRSLDNDALARRYIGAEARTVHQLIGGRVWPVTSLFSPFEVSNATDNAVLNVQAGGRNPFEWNFARSALELKDMSATYKNARDFLRQIAGGRFRGLLTVKAAASAFLTYKFGIAPTASDIGQLLGTSRSLLRHTYPVLRTLAAYAEGAALATVTGRSAISFGVANYTSLFASRLDVEYKFDGLSVRTNFSVDPLSGNRGYVNIFDSGVPLPWQPSQPLHGTRVSVTQSQWEVLESRRAAPLWVWVPEDGVAFVRYSTDKVKAALGSSFKDIIGSLDSLTTGWEVLPLSFVVDWFTNVRSSITAMDNFIHANRLDLTPENDGAWYSTRYRLKLACPIYRKSNSAVDYHVHYRYRSTEIEMGSSPRRRYTVAEPKQGSIRMRSNLVGVNLLDTSVKAYARNLLDGAPLTALIPRLEVSLNAGKLSSLLAMLLS